MTRSNNKNLSRRNWLGIVSTASLGTGVFAGSSKIFGQGINNYSENSCMGTRVYNIRDFGAMGDGKTLDTVALQSAIDTCNKDNGGTVLIPAGTFVIGTVELKSNVTLHISAQGKLLGSDDGKQYYAADAIPLRGEHTMGDGNVGLIFAANAQNIIIEGQGTIDGQGAQFRPAVRGAVPPAGIGGNKRPHHLLFYNCKNLIIKDIFLKDCAYHSVRICVCSYVKIDGIQIYSRVNHNNDGLHFISSEYVHVNNCDIKCQDDACALFGSCKFFTVTNCTFSTRWSVFRFGGGEAENITVSNCIIYETYGCPIKMRCGSGSRYENISFSNIIMKNVTGPISIGLGPQRPNPDAPRETPGIVRNISFNGIHATVSKPVVLPDVSFGSAYNPGEMFSCIILNGMDEGYLENISFDNVHVTFPGGGTTEHAAVRDVPKIASEYYVIGIPPAYGMYARNVRGLTLNNVRFEMAAPDMRPALILDNVQDASINAFNAHGQMETESLLRFIETQDVLLNAPRALSATSTFLQVEGRSCNNIKIDGGDLSKAKTTLSFKAGSLSEAVILH